MSLATNLSALLWLLLSFVRSNPPKRRHADSQAPMRKPTIRVTKWLADIPVEAGCSACPIVVFRAKGSGHRPNREEYQKSLQEQFDGHCRALHFRNTRST